MEIVITEQIRQSWRQDRMSEQGTEPPCPMCEKPRVRRSDYIRCNPCGVNWLEGENLANDPRVDRYREVIMRATAQRRMAQSNGAQTVAVPSNA